MIDLRLLGAVEVRSGLAGAEIGPGQLQPKRMALLLYLALAEPAGLHSRDRLLALFWPEASAASARHSLRNALHALRVALGDQAIVTRGEALVGLDFSQLRCDVVELREYLAHGRVDEALSLIHGDIAPGFFVSGAPEFERWLDQQRAALALAVRSAAWERAGALDGKGAEEVVALRTALKLDPGNEAGARRLMQKLADAGDRAGALQLYQELAEWLGRELEMGPSPETVGLADQIRLLGPVRRMPRIDYGPVAADAVAAAQPTDPASRTNEAVSTQRRLTRSAVALGLLGVLLVSAGMLFSRKPVQAFDPAAEAERSVLRLPARYRADTSAYSSYLRGLTLRIQFDFPASRDTLAALVDREPLYVPGLYGLAHAWLFLALNDLTNPEEAWHRSDALARRALALDSTAASAWLVLASADMFRERDFLRARQRITRAWRLDSLDPDVAGMRSVWFRFHGQMDSAVHEAEVARRIDPLSLYFGRLLAKQLFLARRYDESYRLYNELRRDYAGAWRRTYFDLAELCKAMGRPREAVEWLRQGREASGDLTGAAALAPADNDDEALELLRADARRRLDGYDRSAEAGNMVPPSRYAQAWAVLGDTTEMLDWLDSMLVTNDSYMHHVRLNPAFDILRNSERYHAWEARTGLPPMAIR